MMDIIISAIALITLLPVLVPVAFFVKATSPGPIFFRQQRWGKNCEPISVLKFRTMYVDMCDPTGVKQTLPGDNRVTRFGAFLRKNSIDELPQLLNVLKGDMSLVGPRCHAIGMKAGGMLYEELVPCYHERHRMRPGITGLAQMRGYRGPTDTPLPSKLRVASDLYYINNYSVVLDIKIIIGTFINELRGGTGI